MTKFEALKRKLRKRGVRNPYALASWIEERKGGKAALVEAKEESAPSEDTENAS